MKKHAFIQAILFVLIGVAYFVGFYVGEMRLPIETTRTSEYNRTAYRDLESSELRIVREIQVTEYEPAARQWISRDNVPGADTTIDDRVLLIFFDSSITRFDTVTYEID